jgi:hypothetical protein
MPTAVETVSPGLSKPGPSVDKHELGDEVASADGGVDLPHMMVEPHMEDGVPSL